MSNSFQLVYWAFCHTICSMAILRQDIGAYWAHAQKACITSPASCLCGIVLSMCLQNQALFSPGAPVRTRAGVIAVFCFVAAVWQQLIKCAK
jgi:hypothetical protein